MKVKNFYLHVSAILMLVVGIGLNAVAAGEKSSQWNRDADVRKADYIFLEGLRQHELGKNDAYHELLSHSYSLNDTDRYVGFEYGILMMTLLQDDSTYLEKGYNLLKDYVVNNPSDFYNNVMFVSVANSIGKVDDAISVLDRLHRNNPGRSEVSARYAGVLAQTGKSENIDKAIALFDTIEVAEGRSIPLSSQKIQLYLMREDTASILKEAYGLLASSPRRVDYNVFVGDMQMLFGSRDSALRYYDKAVEIDPTNGVAYYSRANYYRAIGDSVAYDKEVFQALRQENLELEPKLEILKDYVSALYTDSLQQPRISSLFRELIEQHPHEVAIHNLYRDYLIAINDYAGAAEQSSYSLDIDPSDVRQWIALSSLYMLIRDFDKSLDAANRGLHYFESNPDLYMLAATGLTQLDRHDEAMNYLKRGLQYVDSTNAEVMSEFDTAIGDTYYSAGELDSAFVYYDRAIELNPLNLTALNNCAYYLACEDKDLDRAEKLITVVVDERPDDSTSLDTYAWVLFKKKNYEKAKEVIEKAIENDDDPSSELYDHAGDIMFMNRQPDEALDYWKAALDLDPDNDLLQRKVKHKTYFYK